MSYIYKRISADGLPFPDKNPSVARNGLSTKAAKRRNETILKKIFEKRKETKAELIATLLSLLCKKIICPLKNNIFANIDSSSHPYTEQRRVAVQTGNCWYNDTPKNNMSANIDSSSHPYTEM